MATKPKMILLKCKDGDQREGRLGATPVTPGMVVEVSVAGVVTPASSTANMIAVSFEMSFFGKGIDDRYTVQGEAVEYAILLMGDVFYGLLQAGSNAAAGDLLANDGAGGLVVTTDTEYAFAKAMEDVDNSAGTGYVRVRAEVTRDTMPATTAALPVITVDPADDSILSGATATLTVTATGQATLHYQWYRGIAPDATTPVGTDSDSFTTPALTSDKDYWVKVYNLYGSDNSATAHITVT